MTEARTTPPDDEKDPADPARADGDGLADLGVGVPTDDAPTIITKHTHRSEDLPGGGLRGRRLLHFELIEPIGVGGMAAVIRARDTQLDRLVALKILPPDMAADLENVRRFHQEARSAAKLDHENVARVFFCGEDQHLHFIAFEFVEGDNLRTILERRGRLPVGEALHYILQVAAGLAHAAHRGVVHRDIKPSNIIVTPTGRAKLVDMGLARTMERQDDKGLTQSGVTLGTFDYISPEQALEPREADVRSDIYSLGCTLYHVLTGQPPVPDGTAAKKLHHHQHIKPRDPRELVPGLPDEVAFILDRMMAKNPKDRYQSPEQLVHHLLVAARKAGSAANIPEGVLAVEAPMPAPPGSRPLLLVGVAVGLVIALVVALEVFNRAPAAPPPQGERRHPSANANDPKNPPTDLPPSAVVKDQNDKPPPNNGVEPPPVPASDTYTYKDATPDDLANWLQKHRGAAKIVVRLARDLDLSVNNDGTAGLFASAGEVTIQPDKDGQRPTIRLSYGGQPQNTALWAALTVEADKVAVKGVRFLVDAKAGNVRMAGLVLRGRPAGAAPSFIVENCEFLQFRPAYQDNRLASLLVDATGGLKPTLDLRHSCFFGLEAEQGAGPPDGAAPVRLDRGGHDAVVRRGPAVIQAVDCAFGPHAAAFRLEGRIAEEDKDHQPLLSLAHCTVLLNGGATTPDGPKGGAVFDLPGNDGAAIKALACLFSRPQGPDAMVPARGAVLIRQGEGASVAFRESDNRYHGLDAYWPLGEERVDWTGFQNVVALQEGGAPSRLLAVASPWKANPLDALKGFKLSDEPDALAAAFQIDERNPDLRMAGENKQHPVGVETLGAVSYVKLLSDADGKPDPLANKKRFVEPGNNDSAKRIYGSLELAITAAEPGDLILLRFDGPLTVGPVPKKDSLDLRILPDVGRRPVLVFGTREVESALFRVFDGKLSLEGLEFLLQPSSKEQLSQALVALSGQGQCSLKNCVVTFDPATYGTTLALATLKETAKMMPTPKPAEMAPQLSLEGCFLRGDGDLVTTPANRSFDLKAINTLAALKGSVVNVEHAADSSGVMTVHLNRVTTYLGGNLLRLHNQNLKSPPTVKCEANDCLFVAAGRDLPPLVHLDECDFAKEDIKSKVTWDGARNVYGNYTTMLDQAQADDSMTMMAPVLPEKWDQFWGKSASTGRLVPNFKFAGPLPEGLFKGVLPAQFKAPEGTDAGAEPASLLLPSPRSPEPK